MRAGRVVLACTLTMAFVPGLGPALAAPPGAAPEDIARAPGASSFPLDDGLFVRQWVDIDVDAQGKVTRRVENALKVFGQWPISHGYFDPTLTWNDSRATLKIDQARTYAADGRVVDAKANSFVENTAGALERAAPYAQLRQMTVAQVGVEENGTTVLGFTIADRAPSGVPLWGVLQLDGQMPMLDQRVTFTVPAAVKLLWSGVDCRLTPETETAGGSTKLVFRRRNVPGVNVAESPDGRTGVCRLAYSAARDWAAVREFLEQRVDAAAAPDAAVKAKTAELVRDALSGPERMARLHAFVVDGVQTIRWPLDELDYAVRSAGAVLDSSVGHSLDKAVLLASMLRVLDYDARVALVARDRGVPPDIPSPALLEDAWVVVAQGPHQLWLDPTAPLEQRNQNHLAGCAALLLDGKASGLAVLPQLEQSSNRAALKADLKLEDAGAELRVRGGLDLDLAGLYNPLPGYDRSKDRLTAIAAAAARGFGGAEVKEVAVGWKSAQVTALHASVAGGALPAPRDGRPVKLLLPRPPGAISADSLQLHRGRRTLPLPIPGPAEELAIVTLDLPEKVEVLFAPAEVQLDNSVGALARSVTREGRRLTITTVLKLKKAEVAPEEYPLLRALFAELDAVPGRSVLLRPF